MSDGVAPSLCVARVAADPYAESDYRKGHAQLRLNPLLVKIETGKVSMRERKRKMKKLDRAERAQDDAGRSARICEVALQLRHRLVRRRIAFLGSLHEIRLVLHLRRH
jgi:hypothetical protein